ncbi:preprotein translocase subunit SecA [Persicitalea jodogahamensis]|uniref:Protein translocase subunit SecA n=1 Tax=Persicitalea jodogahamensis TaxID=402147 RepID=A0A8J3D400_9BACT|nr:preprotein translocase subunit SecA [Persicitalea jodogahamensis]GHB55568.1 protein translocase subunit SecA [Persicitalea jodogahamensis]
MLKIFSKLFGTKADRDLKELTPYVGRINAEFEQLASISNDELRQRATDLRAYIAEQLKPIDDQIATLKQQAEDEPDVDSKEAIFKQIDDLGEERNQELEKVLEEILPKGFAIVKETARRFKENDQLEVTASFFDREVAAKKSHVTIDGEKAIWQSTWNVIGQPTRWQMVHYDVQLVGGVVLHKGKIAEMATGEGKTLVATLPAFLNALAGLGVHIVTVNDYLAKRDAEWNAPLFEFHGMSVDCIDRHEPNTLARRNAYKADLTYGTNNEFGFDYLRDNMSRSPEELVQRKHHFAMVDEVDSVLIDDARTPLIISGPVPRGDEQEYMELKPRVARIVEAQRKLTMELLNDARKKIAAGDKEEGGLALFRAFRGTPKYKPLIKFLSEGGMKALLQETEGIYLAENQKRMPEADAPLYFTIDERQNSIELTEKGIDFLTGESVETNFFIMPDIAVELNDIEKDAELNEQERVVKKEALIRDYTVKAARIHTVNQLLKAYNLFEKDVEYVIMDGKVKIVDEQTGRIMDGRRYSDGLHQAIEAKESVKVEDATQTYATVTLQNYFRMYHKLAGMTGTAETEAGEFWEIYKLDVVSIPTNVPVIRKDEEDKVYRSVREKYNAVADEIVEMVEGGRPVLVGTTSVENSEIISRMLTLRKIPHQVLNAKQHQREADVVSQAGIPGTVTIATNMAGRGTDIKLTPDAKAAGGLAIIGTERHESRRVDRQLRGRAGRQGDTGSSQFFVSLEDNLMRLFGSDRMAKVMDRMGLEEGEVIQHSMITKSIERAQRKVEENNFGTRKRLLEYDDVMNYQRDAIYRRRRNALFGERLAVDIANTLFDVCEDIVASTGSDYAEFELATLTAIGIEPPFDESEYGGMNAAQRSQKLYQAAEKHYREKNATIAAKALPVLKQIHAERGATISEIMIPFTDGMRQAGVVVNLEKAIKTEGREIVREMEKAIVLSLIDQEWKEHLREMDDLKQSVQNAVFEQKDPLLIYKFESVELFKRFLSKVNFDMLSFLMKADIPQEQTAPENVQRPPARRQPNPALQTNRGEETEDSGENGPNQHARHMENTVKQQPARSIKIADRNQKVTVQYRDGRVLKNIKYKKVEQDVENGVCVVME